MPPLCEAGPSATRTSYACEGAHKAAYKSPSGRTFTSLEARRLRRGVGRGGVPGEFSGRPRAADRGMRPEGFLAGKDEGFDDLADLAGGGAVRGHEDDDVADGAGEDAAAGHGATEADAGLFPQVGRASCRERV